MMLFRNSSKCIDDTIEEHHGPYGDMQERTDVDPPCRTQFAYSSRKSKIVQGNYMNSGTRWHSSALWE
jgi:hypothetical protein